MNIYNKLFIVEYTRNPHSKKPFGYKAFYLNMSKKKYWYYHRKFDLTSLIHKDYKYWYRFYKHHRLMGPANISHIENFKTYYINGSYKRNR